MVRDVIGAPRIGLLGVRSVIYRRIGQTIKQAKRKRLPPVQTRLLTVFVAQSINDQAARNGSGRKVNQSMLGDLPSRQFAWQPPLGAGRGWSRGRRRVAGGRAGRGGRGGQIALRIKRSAAGQWQEGRLDLRGETQLGQDVNDLDARLAPHADHQRLFVTPWFHVTPDLQVLDPARQNVATALLLGVRARLSF